MIDSTVLLPALKAQVLQLEDDLRARLDDLPEVVEEWRTEHRRLVEAGRTANAWVAWRDDRVTQVAVAWVLTTVFLRFAEDNALLRPVWIAGPRERRQEVSDAQLAYFRQHPDDTDREWLLSGIDYLKSVPTTRNLVGEHSPLWLLSPSGNAATVLLTFWRQRDDGGDLRFDFADEGLSTRFLGDLYQDLSEHAKKTYALLQTPEFVEEFILDQAMEPALAERPLDGFTIIDPTCGSGHFLLGAFRRLLERWDRQAPAMELQARAQLALGSVFGVDVNSFAVDIARFRLTIAALQVCGLKRLEDAPDWDYHLEVGDALLRYEGEHHDVLRMAYRTEDVRQLEKILTPGQFDVVVGNPPYITVKDKALNELYRVAYSTCKGTYAMTVPFMERFFDLAKRPEGDHPAGWMGCITSNSFMKREFGSKLIEEFLPHQDLRLVVDTSGAYIPGHGTPTVVIAARRQDSTAPTVRAVLGIRGEPGRPDDPAKGLVWSSITRHVYEQRFEDEWISVDDLERATLARHPWSLSGGQSGALLKRLNHVAKSTLSERWKRCGFYGDSHADEAFFLSMSYGDRIPKGKKAWLKSVRGEDVRDWTAENSDHVLLPYDDKTRTLLAAAEILGSLQHLWPLRTTLWERSTFGGESYRRAGRAWWEWHQLPRDLSAHPWTLTFAFVATHNHFVLDRGGKVFNRSAPVLKLPKEATEDDHLGLLGVLNSSTACFWLKQNSYPKGGDPIGNDGARVSQQPWSDRYEFTGTTLEDFPLPSRLPLDRARRLDDLAQRLAAHAPESVVASETPAANVLSNAEDNFRAIRAEMVGEQEELDWEVYGSYDLPGGDLVYNGDDRPALDVGQRAFEIALARKVAAGEDTTTWFSRHNSAPTTEVPAGWPAGYRDVVQRRLDLIESEPQIKLLEKPEHKRRWASEPWEIQQERATRTWLLDRLDNRAYWSTQGRPLPQSVSQLADRASRDPDLVSVLQLWEGRPDIPVVKSLTRLLADEAVPFLAAHRLKDSGLRKREAWEETWALQRREDAGENVGPIPVPPKYTNADFRKPPYWQARGKLDVPKERFILYPDAGRNTDATPLLGWAGWDHAQQALALATIIGQREEEGWRDDRLVPLVAGLAELQPWVEQWHADVDPTYGVSLAAFCREQLADRSRQVGLTIAQLAAWRPAAPTRGRKART